MICIQEAEYVGDMTTRHGIILAKSIPAKKFGGQTGETIGEAKKKCPGLMLIPPNYDLYEKSSAAFIGILHTYSDAVEQYSIDEAFIDMTESAHLFGGARETAERMREQPKWFYWHLRKRLGQDCANSVLRQR